VTNSESMSTYWTHQHGQKRIYTDPFTADRAAIKLTEDRGRDGQSWEAYECRWGQWYQNGRTAELHRHIGRRGRRHR
jgi:hypothetical protein